MQTVTKNTQIFLETLQISASHEVKDWDLNALERAFGWAKYCQEVGLLSLQMFFGRVLFKHHAAWTFHDV